MKLCALGIFAVSGTAYAQGVELTPLSLTGTGLTSPTGLDFHEPSGSLTIATDGASSLVRVFDDESSSPFSSASGFTGDRIVETVRSSALTFTPGDVFTTNGRPGEIVRVSADGATVVDPWVTLPAGAVRGLHVDATGLFGGDLFAVTDLGGMWRIDATGVAGTAPFFATTEALAGVVVVPDDPTRYGGLAGRVVAGTSTTTGRLYAVDPAGVVTHHSIGVTRMRDIDIVSGTDRLYGVERATGEVLASASGDFAALDGEIVVTQQAFSLGSGLHVVTWPWIYAVATPVDLAPTSAVPTRWGGVAFGTLSLPPVDDPPAEAEMWLVVGRRGGRDVFTPADHPFLVQLSRIRGHHAVTLDDTPGFEIVERKRKRRYRRWRGVRLFEDRRVFRHFTVQVVAHDPTGHPNAPDRWSRPMRVFVCPNGWVFWRRYGHGLGLEIRPELGKREDGRRVLRFPVTVPTLD